MSSALAVDDPGDVADVGGVEVVQGRAAREPPAQLAVEVLDLAALPGRVGVTESDFDVVGGGDSRRVGPSGSLVEGNRGQQMGGMRSRPAARAASMGVGGVGLGPSHPDAVAVARSVRWRSEDWLYGADVLVAFPVAHLGSIPDCCGQVGGVGHGGALFGVAVLAGPPSGPSRAQAVLGLHGQHPGVDGGVDRPAHTSSAPSVARSARIASGDRPAVSSSDPVPQLSLRG